MPANRRNNNPAPSAEKKTEPPEGSRMSFTSLMEVQGFDNARIANRDRARLGHAVREGPHAEPADAEERRHQPDGAGAERHGIAGLELLLGRQDVEGEIDQLRGQRPYADEDHRAVLL